MPILFPATVDRLTMADEIEVLGTQTSGEAEFVLIYHQGQTYVAAGSDHTDRELEKTSITFAKQVCPNVLSPEVWRYADVRELLGSDHPAGPAWAREGDGRVRGPAERRRQEGRWPRCSAPKTWRRSCASGSAASWREPSSTAGQSRSRMRAASPSVAPSPPFWKILPRAGTLRCAYRVREVPLTDDG